MTTRWRTQTAHTRILDYKREAPGIRDVVRIEYDLVRSAHITLLHTHDPNVIGEQKWSYIIATEALKVESKVQSFRQGIPVGFIPGFDSALSVEEVDDNSDTVGRSAKRKRVELTESFAVGLLRSLTLIPGNVVSLRLIPPRTVINTISL